MLEVGNILYVDAGTNPRVYEIKQEFYNDSGRRWFVCHIFYSRNIPDETNYHIKASKIEKYIEWSNDPDLEDQHSILIDNSGLAKFLLERKC